MRKIKNKQQVRKFSKIYVEKRPTKGSISYIVTTFKNNVELKELLLDLDKIVNTVPKMYEKFHVIEKHRKTIKKYANRLIFGSDVNNPNLAIRNTLYANDGTLNEEQLVEKFTDESTLKVGKQNRPFIISNNLRQELIDAPKKLIGQTFFNYVNDYNEKSLSIKNILVGTVNGKDHLFVQQILIPEKQPKLSAPLNLHVGGHENLSVLLGRTDVLAHAPLAQMEDLKIKTTLKRNVAMALDEKAKHFNFQPSFSNMYPESVPTYCHNHTGNEYHDLINAALSIYKHYIPQSGKLSVQFTKQNAQPADLFSENLLTDTEKENIDKTKYLEAKNNNGYYKIKRFIEYIYNEYNIEKNDNDILLNPQIQNYLDKCRINTKHRKSLHVLDFEKEVNAVQKEKNIDILLQRH